MPSMSRDMNNEEWHANEDTHVKIRNCEQEREKMRNSYK